MNSSLGKRAALGIMVSAAVIFGSLVLQDGSQALGQSRSQILSPSCIKVRNDAVHAYWQSTVSAKQAERMDHIAQSGSYNERGAGMVAEALAGRVTVRQLGASSLAGFDAVDSSALCGELDRQNTMRLRLLLPQLMIQLADQIANQRKLKQ